MIEVRVTRKPKPEPLPPFDCVCCQNKIEEKPWFDVRHEPPVCESCRGSWGKCGKPPGMKREDWRSLQRLKAVTERLKWEIYNGGGRSPYFPAQ